MFGFRDKVSFVMVMAMVMLAAAMTAAWPASGDVYWLNHLELVPGSDRLKVTYSSTSSLVGGGTAGITITCTASGESNLYEVYMGVEAPLNQRIAGVRVCYEYSTGQNPSPTYISGIRMIQIKNPTGAAIVLQDTKARVNPGPLWADTDVVYDIDPGKGPLLLIMKFKFANTKDRVAIRGLGLILK